MLNRTTQLAAAVAIALLALPAAAGSWPNIAPHKSQAKVAQVATPAKPSGGFIGLEGENLSTLEPVRYFTNEEKGTVYMPRVASNLPARGVAPASVNDFYYTGGEPGWRPVGHKLIWSAGRFVHSDECDHAIRAVRAATAEEIAATNALSPGS